MTEFKREIAELPHRLAVAVEVKFAAGAPAGTFSGYGAIFGNLDAYGDVIQRGAFAESLRKWRAKGKWPPMLLQHGGGFIGGGADDLVPIGVWKSIEEDARGLKVTGQLIALNTDRAQAIHAALKAKALDGLSIGYTVKASAPGKTPSEPRRTLTAVELLELSIVTFPANDQAVITDVKSIATIRDFQNLLHAIGFPNAAAKKLAAGGWPALARKATSATEITAYFRQAAADLKAKG